MKLCNKSRFKNATGVNATKFAEKVDLSSLECEFDKWDIDKLVKVPTGSNRLKSKVDNLDVDKLVHVLVVLILSKLNDVVKNDIVKNNEYDAKIKDIEDKVLDITNLATNTTINVKKNEVKNEVPSTTSLAATTALNEKINDIKNKIPNITNLATTSALTAVENEIPDHSKYITTPICWFR